MKKPNQKIVYIMSVCVYYESKNVVLSTHFLKGRLVKCTSYTTTPFLSLVNCKLKYLGRT